MAVSNFLKKINVYLLTPRFQIFPTYNFDTDIIRFDAKGPFNGGLFYLYCVCVCVSLKYSNIGELKHITLDFPDLPSRGEGDTFRHFLNPCIVNKLKGTDYCKENQHYDISSYG